MASRINKSMVPALHKWLGTTETGGLSDGWLLQRFVVEIRMHSSHSSAVMVLSFTMLPGAS
ncbi:MAG TPA: hypothetical protein VGY66_23065 [Gemmataceae bacterium]|jgi:hypothetical protein|nr:hypothetical protein [Gemmataceae bacterium]